MRKLSPLSHPRNRDGQSRNHLSRRCMNQVMCTRMSTPRGKESEKGKDTRSRPKFIGHCFWCGAHGHTKSDCRKKAAGKPTTAWSPTLSGWKGKDESSRASERTLSLEKWPDTGEEAICRSFGSVSRHGRYSQRDWQAWEKIQGQALRQWKSYKSETFGANAVDAVMGERIDLTIDCCICRRDARVAQGSSRVHRRKR